MSHFSLNLPSSDTLWYTPTPMEQQQQQQKSLPFFYPSSLSLSSSHDVESDNSSSNNNNNNSNNNNNTTPITTNVVDRSETTSSTSSFDREYMFEKPLTPSDVGKLNRLVIPKQHAEKYFPLASATSDSSTAVVGADKSAAGSGGGGGGGGGVLLGFEDESGKCWKFRYSYWNSSQSYVLTKGWSRYVKEKKLDAGDVVLFDRHRFESDRFFIGWRRRGSPPVHNPGPVQFNNNNNHQNYGVVQSQGFNGGPHLHQISSFPSYRPDCLHAGTEVRQKGRKSGGGNSKRVRLFGVNLECQIEEEEEDIEEPQTSDGSSLSSQGQGQVGSGSGFGVGPAAYNYFDYVGYPSNHNYSNHMDMNFSQDVNQMRNRLR